MDSTTSISTVVPRRASTHRVQEAAERTDELPQLGLGRIIAIWAAAALPMAIMAWVIAPLVAERLTGAGGLARALIVTLTFGLIWQFALVVILVAREQRTLRWPVVRHALWLRSPRAPSSGRRGGRMWLIVVPLLIGFAAEELVPSPGISLARDFPTFIDSAAGHDLLSGSWAWFAVIAALAVFNTVLGEELLFRGYLLPRMNGVFGRRDWLANGVLFAVYHLHMPWVIPAALLDTFFISYPSKRYRSALIGIVVHSAQSVVLLGLVFALVLDG